MFFEIITRQAIRRGSFASVKDLTTAISRCMDGWNERCHPFVWTKTADQILPHATRQAISDAGHRVGRDPAARAELTRVGRKWGLPPLAADRSRVWGGGSFSGAARI